MSIIVKSSGDFVPAPEGMHNAVCVDVVDKGIMETKWGRKHKVSIVWEIEATMPDGKRFMVSKWYTAVLGDKATLSKDLQVWRGKAFTPEELRGFELEKVVGAPCRLVIIHTIRSDGSTFGNAQAVLKADPEKRLAPAGTYIRVKDRTPEQQKPGNAGSGKPEAAEEIPF